MDGYKLTFITRSYISKCRINKVLIEYTGAEEIQGKRIIRVCFLEEITKLDFEGNKKV